VIKLLFLGDIVGKSGRQAVEKHLPELREKYNPNLVIVNAENAARGMGITKKICNTLYSAGVDCITTGNHIWDNKDIIKYINDDHRLLRPNNYPNTLPGKGTVLLETVANKKVLIVNLMGQIFMSPQLDSPVTNMEKILQRYVLGKNVDAIFVDFHAETTSEKQSFANYFDGKISAMIGTHTHTPTADERILPKGTGMQTDTGMCGDYKSIIGMKLEAPLERLSKKYATKYLETADGPGTLAGTYLEISPDTNLTKKIDRILFGEKL